MEIMIKSRNLDLRESVKEYIRRKVGKLDRHLPSVDPVDVEVGKEKTRTSGERYVVQITTGSRGTLLRGQEKGDSVEAAIDAAVDVLGRQMERFKGKAYRSLRRVSAKEVAATALEPEGEHVIRVKRFPVKPMTPEEAVEQMELLGHDFFLFLSAENGKYCVVYRRGEDGYGMIEPELA